MAKFLFLINQTKKEKNKLINFKFFSILLVIYMTFLPNLMAESIKDFQIEGISIGDSALRYYTEDQIIKNSRDYYKDKTFTPTQNIAPNFFQQYDFFDYTFRTNDKNYLMTSIAGIISYENKDINDCYDKMDEIDIDINNILNSFKRTSGNKIKSKSDPNGKSTYSQITYRAKDGVINITCYDNSSRNDSMSFLSISVRTKELSDFLMYKAYK